MHKLNALIIDDDVQFCRTFKLLSKDMFNLSVAHTSNDGLRQLEKENFEVVLLDYQLNENKTGLEVLKKIHAKYPELPIIMITGYPNIELSVKAMQYGATDFTTKTPNIKELWIRLKRQLQDVNWKLLCQSKDDQIYGKFVYKSAVMQRLMKHVEKIAAKDFPILINGETGTGKGVLAREIHRQSARGDKPFVSVNCSNLPPNLFESELFGYERGAFTGADHTKKGKLELANHGTIFLDEIGALDLESQAKILTAIEEKTFSRLGSEKEQIADVRVIAATNADLEKCVQEGTFRQDLFYRLNVIPITIPPLRERKDDIMPLAKYFLEKASNGGTMEIAGTVKTRLEKNAWPGNVRELKSVIERSLVYNDSTDKLNVIHLNTTERLNGIDLYKLLELPYDEAKNKLLLQFQELYFKPLLAKHDGNISAAAEEARVNRTTIHRILHDIKKNR